jgi:uracil-DNA glycosylase
MTLFDNVPHQQQTWDSPIYDWAEFLSDKERDDLDMIINRVRYEREHHKIWPTEENVFRAFLMHPSKVKVVILGQDPYHTKDQATGHAFACGSKLSPSLRVILETVDRLYPNEEPEYGTLHLDSWVDQGVLLLNTILTVRQGKPLSHEDIGWQKITKSIITNFGLIYPETVFMLWGEHAQTYRKYLPNNRCILDTHPAAYARSGKVWDTRCFQTTNNYLENKIRWKINWKLQEEILLDI